MPVCRRVGTRAALGLALLVLAAAAFLAGQHVRSTLGVGADVACADDEAAPAATAPVVEHRPATVDGQPTGEVLINDQVVVRIRIAAGGLSAEERAMIVAKRLHDWVAEDGKPEDLEAVEEAGGAAAVMAGDTTIVTITDADAQASHATSVGLARMWRDNIAVALGGEPAPTEEEPTEEPEVAEQPAATEETAPAEWAPEEAYKDKIVPIMSVLAGIKVGAARVNGPDSKVEMVQAVAQLETHFKKVVEIDVYVPITTDKPETKLDRVQGVGVTALGDIRL